MQATGIVRRVDDLGRVVIPKEIRKAINIREADPLEIFVDQKNRSVTFKKYYPMCNASDSAMRMCHTLNAVTNMPVAICNKDQVVAAAGPQHDTFTGKDINDGLREIMEGRQSYFVAENVKIPAFKDVDDVCVAVAAPIISLGNLEGCVVFLRMRDMAPCGPVETKLAQSAAVFLGKELND